MLNMVRVSQILFPETESRGLRCSPLPFGMDEILGLTMRSENVREAACVPLDRLGNFKTVFRTLPTLWWFLKAV